ncbi:MAG TPA: hypothetical protein ACFYEF_07095 [Candidatus Wunengus sp. YC63]|uniref:hypothetical protein n=1 Tax=unclassified Candidatus Wunengus TaxID=3367695 RepID=UPI001E02AE47|nr:hypothetical protein [Planctomycetota bacterium]MBI5796324.1 hypothetical protein [Planctomycetota bacterium]
MKIKYFMFVLFVWCLLVNGSSYCIAEEKKKGETVVHGVMIVTMDAPLRATIGRKVNVEVVVGNERATKVTTILTVTCPTTKQQIGREAETLDGLSSQKIVYSWNTEGLKEGTYVIRAEVEKVPGETDVNDNVRQLEIILER